ncbi:MAG TPA: alkaline phosphatase family protein [Actinomycetota bacterium]
MAAALLWVLVSSACTEDRRLPEDAASARDVPGGDPCGLPAGYFERIRNGHDPTRSGNLQIVPEEPHFFGEWLSHSGPWPYLQRVPLLFLGPGVVPARGWIPAPATTADIAPTLAAMMGSTFSAPDGRTLRAAIDDEAPSPRVAVVVVWDSVGVNVLESYPDAWPALRRLSEQGVWFDRATVGTSPTTTGAVHATIGTGAWPRTHRRVGHQYVSGGRIVESAKEGPADLEAWTLADHWDQERGNRPLAGLVAFKAWHLGLLGHGSFLRGGDRDLAVTLDFEMGRWTLEPPDDAYFRPIPYAGEVDVPEQKIRDLDLEDGRLDGRWLGEPVLERPDDLATTPAYAAWQTDLIQQMVRREGMGDDAITDLIFTNYNQPDLIGHRWSMNSPQMERAVRSLDEELGRLVGFLDEEIGRGGWVLALTADHGATPDPEVSGATILGLPALREAIGERFAPGEDPRGLVTAAAPNELWIDEARLLRDGASLEDVAEHLRRLTIGDVMGPRAGDDASDPLLAAAFPSRALGEHGCG